MLKITLLLCCAVFALCDGSAENCPANEELSFCFQALCRNQRCTQRGRPVVCPQISEPCREGCVCKGGFLRDANGACIKEEQCPSNADYKPKCNENEEYTKCTESVCRPQSCTEKDNAPKCTEVVGKCYEGCVCKENYFRNEEYYCVPRNKC